ncbi:MAG: PKD domain-containing protein, partial [Bacteroidota bacterium]
VTYSFPIPGDYTVCGLATVYDLANNVVCLVDSCQLVTVEDPCAYSIGYLINGQTIDLNLSNPGFPAPDIATWFIDGPNGGVIGSGENIQYVFPEGGIYTVCIDYQVNGLACPAVLCETVTILEDCVASFSVTSLTVTDFQFDDLSTGNYSNFQWDFGDGLQSNALNPIHTYDVEGVYTVCLTIWDNDNFCQSTLCQDITVDFSPICDNILLVAAFSVPPGPSGLTIDFSNNSITDQSFGVFYEWDFGDGATSIDENPSHTYSAPGVYNVCLDMGWDGPVLCYADPICMNITVPLSVPSCNAVIAQTVVDSYGLFEVINNDNPNVPYSHVDWTVALNGVNIFLESNVNPFYFDFPQPGVYQ